jgi:hypothetical protein
MADLGLLRRIDDFDSFKLIRNVAPESISLDVVDAVRNLDEREELELHLRLILHDPNATPYGPAEIVDILTHKLSIQRLTKAYCPSRQAILFRISGTRAIGEKS